MSLRLLVLSVSKTLKLMIIFLSLSYREAVVARALTDSNAVKDQLVAVEAELRDLQSRSSQQEALYLEEVERLQVEIQEVQAQAPASGSDGVVDMEMFESELNRFSSRSSCFLKLTVAFPFFSDQRLLLEQKSMEVEE